MNTSSLESGQREETDPASPTEASALTSVLRALDAVSARWLLLRPWAGQGRRDGDVDLLIGPADLASVERRLRELGFVGIPGLWSTPGSVFVRYEAATDAWVRLHLQTSLTFGPGGGIEQPAEPCLQRRRRQAGGWVGAPADEFWVTLLHCLLDKGLVSPRHRARLGDLARQARGASALEALLRQCLPAGWTAERVIGTVEAGRWSELEGQRSAMLRSWLRRQGILRRIGFALRRVVSLPRRLSARLRRRGACVALVGPDGAGKSSLAQALEACFFSPARCLYMGSGRGGGHPLVTRLRIPGLGRPGRLLVVWGRFLAAQYHRALGRLVIYDRYVYDSLLCQEERSPAGRLLRRLQARMLPRPDLTLLLDVPGETMFRRKGEQAPEALEDQRRQFLALARRVPGMEVVDASRSPALVRTDALERIWRVYSRRWKR